MSLAAFSPLPRPVRLGGRWYEGSPGRVRDLYALADAAAGIAGDPLAGADPSDPASLRAAYDRAEAWPGPWSAVLETVAGDIVILGSVLRTHGLGLAELDEIYRAIDPADPVAAAEWGAVKQCFWRSDPWRIAAAMIDSSIGIIPDTSDGVPWEVAIVETWQAIGGTWESLLEMPLPLFHQYRVGGRREDGTFDDGANRKRRAEWWKQWREQGKKEKAEKAGGAEAGVEGGGTEGEPAPAAQ